MSNSNMTFEIKLLRQFALAFPRGSAAKLPSCLKARTRNGTRNDPRLAECLSGPRPHALGLGALGGDTVSGVASAGAPPMHSGLRTECNVTLKIQARGIRCETCTKNI